MRFYKAVLGDDEKIVDSLPWQQTFERFLSSHPTSKEDCDLFVDVLIFLQLYLNVAKGEMISIEITNKGSPMSTVSFSKNYTEKRYPVFLCFQAKARGSEKL